jgi:hypothetical protein
MVDQVAVRGPVLHDAALYTRNPRHFYGLDDHLQLIAA